MNMIRQTASSAELDAFDERLLRLAAGIDATLAEGVRCFAAGEAVSAAWRSGMNVAAIMAHELADLTSMLMGTNERIVAVSRLKILATLDDALSVSASLVDLPEAGAPARMPRELLLLADAGRVVLRDAVVAGIEGDVNLAREVSAHDAGIETLHTRLVEETRRRMREDPALVSSGAAVLLVASGLERIANLGNALADAVLLRALRGT